MRSPLFAALFVFALLLAPIAASAAGITISPPKFEYSANPGDLLTGMIKITNQDTVSLRVLPAVQDFIAAGETGQPGFVDAGKGEHSISIAPWISVGVNNEEVVIAGNETKEIPFTITVPATAEPGGHYGAIFFAPPSGAGQVAIVQRIGALVLVRVNGAIKEEGRLDTFGAFHETEEQMKASTPLSDLKKASFYSSLPAAFVVRFENTGNVHVKPVGKIEMTNFGFPLHGIGVETKTNDKGVPIEQNIVDYLPVNDEAGNVLAKSFRRFDTLYQGTAFWYQKEDGTKELRYRSWLPLGYYTAKLTLNYGAGHEPIVEEISFLLLPWKEIGGMVFASWILFISLKKYRRWSRERLKAALRAELESEKRKK